MNLVFANNTNIGFVREVNQDCYSQTECEWGHLFVVADGLGHKKGGQFASRKTVEYLVDEYSRQDPGDIPSFLKTAIENANTAIYEQKIREFDNAMLGTTCVALIIKSSQAFIANVGDSRAYLLHQGNLTQLTSDQSYVQKLVRDGVITQKEAESHPQKNILLEALGSRTEVKIDIKREPIELTAGDKILICSDGLWGLVTLVEMKNILAENIPEIAIQKLTERALENGGYDNITGQVISIEE